MIKLNILFLRLRRRLQSLMFQNQYRSNFRVCMCVLVLGAMAPLGKHMQTVNRPHQVAYCSSKRSCGVDGHFTAYRKCAFSTGHPSVLGTCACCHQLDPITGDDITAAFVGSAVMNVCSTASHLILTRASQRSKQAPLVQLCFHVSQSLPTNPINTVHCIIFVVVHFFSLSLSLTWYTFYTWFMY